MRFLQALLASATLTLSFPVADPVENLGSTLRTGDTLLRGQYLVPDDPSGPSPYILILQRDGNLVEYHDNVPTWASGTSGVPVVDAVLQADGRLVLHDKRYEVVWESEAMGVVGDDDDGQGEYRLVFGVDGVVTVSRMVVAESTFFGRAWSEPRAEGEGVADAGGARASV